MKYQFTSESVTEGHPDKICDQISDAILDSCLKQDKHSRVACNCFVTGNNLIIGGEITTKAKFDPEKIARRVIKRIGYTSSDMGFTYKTVKIQNIIQKQSQEIAHGVNKGGAGDSGLMFGYADNETKELMPLPIILAHKLAKQLAHVRRTKLKYLRPDGKVQVTVTYDNCVPDVEYCVPTGVSAIVISAQHKPNISLNKLKQDITKYVIKPICKEYMNTDTEIMINPAGSFILGGPVADTGLTGKKPGVDTYGGHGAHGGGAFSGKDSTKVDRSGAYMARYIAKNIVAAGLADKCEIQLSYAIGKEKPVSIFINTFNTNKVQLDEIYSKVRKNFDLTPKGIIKQLDLLKPIYEKTAAYGHFGRNEFSWEKTDLTKKLSF
jgi:S-adenosylmethionine synthetase